MYLDNSGRDGIEKTPTFSYRFRGQLFAIISGRSLVILTGTDLHENTKDFQELRTVIVLLFLFFRNLELLNRGTANLLPVQFYWLNVGQ